MAIYKIGIIGCGQIAELHAERLLKDGRGVITGLYDFIPEQTEKFRKRFAPNASVYKSYESLLGEGSPDGVIICSPTQSHYEQIIKCHQKSISVLCEKPLVNSREQILELIDLYKDCKTFLSLAYQRRCWASYRTLKREVQSGKWGKILAVTSHNVENWQSTIQGTWRDDPSKNRGGIIGDPGSHKIDLIFYVTGLKPINVFANTDCCGSQVEIQASISAILENDVPLTMDMIGNAQYLNEDFHVHCEKADWMYRHGKVYLGQNENYKSFSDLEKGSNPDTDFLDLLSGKSLNNAPLECALPIFDFTEAILKSSQKNRRIEL